ncbi:MAG: hypothetical protein H3C62_05745 [Gemmatimonadaceae bacterium]|nr:hypothetical protein [Gemmatimonadaceae bacterium]
MPVGTFEANFTELRQSHLVLGNGNGAGWDHVWRERLVTNAEILVGQLRQVGVTEIFLDGSFTEAKPHPNDIDGYFECDPRLFAQGLIEQRLNAIDPFKIWTWAQAARRPAPGSMKKQLPMWHRYRVELYPHFPGLLSGIKDIWGNELQFPAAFRQQRGTGLRKGIVKIVP